MEKNEYNGIRKLVSIVLVASSLIGCRYENPVVNEQNSNYPKVELKTPELKQPKKGLENKLDVRAEKSKSKYLSIPEVSYETAMDFFKPKMKKAEVSPEEIEKFKEFIKGDEELRNLMHAIYSNPFGFEEMYGNSIGMEFGFSGFKKAPLKDVSDKELSEIHDVFPLMPETKKELGYLRDTENLTDKQYGDLILLFYSNQLKAADFIGDLGGR